MVWINANPLFSILYYLHWFYIVFHTISKHFTLSISRSKPFSHTYLRRTASIINLVRQANTEPCTVFTTTTSGTRRTESVETGLDTHLVGPVKGLAFTQQNIFTAKSLIRLFTLLYVIHQQTTVLHFHRQNWLIRFFSFLYVIYHLIIVILTSARVTFSAM